MPITSVRALRSNTKIVDSDPPPERKESPVVKVKKSIEDIFWSVVESVKREPVSGSLGRKWKIKVENAAGIVLSEITENKKLQSLSRTALTERIRNAARGS
jgi:hypothetical protein